MKNAFVIDRRANLWRAPINTKPTPTATHQLKQISSPAAIKRVAIVPVFVEHVVITLLVDRLVCRQALTQRCATEATSATTTTNKDFVGTGTLARQQHQLPTAVKCVIETGGNDAARHVGVKRHCRTTERRRATRAQQRRPANVSATNHACMTTESVTKKRNAK